MEILRREAQAVAVATADGSEVVLGPPPPALDVAVHGDALRWEVQLLGEEPRTLARGSGWRAREAEAYAALCAALLALGHKGEQARRHGAPPFQPLPGGQPGPAPKILVPEYELPPMAQRAVAFGSRSVTGGGRFLPDQAPASGPATWVARAVWPAVIATGALPALAMAGPWLQRAQGGGEAFLASAEGLAGMLMLGVAGLMVLIGFGGWLRQLQRDGRQAASGRGAQGFYLLDDALVIKQPVGCTYIPRGRLCGVALRQAYPPFGAPTLAIGYQAEDGQVKVHAPDATNRSNELVLALEAYIQAWRRARGSAP